MQKRTPDREFIVKGLKNNENYFKTKTSGVLGETA